MLLFISSSCHKDNPCDKLVNGVYVYPKIPEDHNWTPEQVDEYVNIPKDVLGCISTQGLIESTMNYPFLGLIYAGANPQSGYDNLVKKRYRGLAELENRNDVAKCCLERYDRMEPADLNPNWTPLERGEFMINFFYYEVLFSQFVILEKLKINEKISLVEEVIEKFESKSNANIINYWGIVRFDGLILSARLMYIDNFSEFLTIMESSQGVGEFTMFISPTYTIEEGEQILAITKNYLNHLKNQKR
jgi:hypothetical protein